MKKLSIIFGLLAVLLSDIMCAVVAYNYRDMLCGIEHAGYSAPSSTAFLLVIPYAIGIAICIMFSIGIQNIIQRINGFMKPLTVEKRKFVINVMLSIICNPVFLTAGEHSPLRGILHLFTFLEKGHSYENDQSVYSFKYSAHPAQSGSFSFRAVGGRADLRLSVHRPEPPSGGAG